VEEIPGITRDAVIGQSVLKVLPGIKDMGLFDIFQHVWRTGQPARHPTTWHQERGVSGWLKNAVYKLPSGEIVAVYSDESKRKQAEAALKKSEAIYRALFDNMMDGIAVYEARDDGKDFVFVDFNKAAEKISETTKDAVIGKSFLKVFPGFKDIGVVDTIKHVWRTGQPTRTPTTWTQDRGISGWLKSSTYKLPSGEIVSIFSDESKRKQAEEALKQYQDILELQVANRTAALLKANEELEDKSRNLEEVNAALNVLLKKREEDKIELEEQVLANMKELTEPYIKKLKHSELNERQHAYVNILELNLREIISPFAKKMSSKFFKLTPMEIQIADLVRHGHTTKETADLLNSSVSAVNFHRNNIRKKLNLKNKKVNLRSYLFTLA